MKISEKTKNIIIILLILICSILVGHYGININGYIDKTSDVLKDNTISSKKEGQLISCIDGDTARLLVNKKEIKVRFLAIDTPEIKHPKKKDEAYGKTASIHTCNMLKEAKKITISYEHALTRHDKYKRDLVWLYVDDKLIQEELVKEGLAKVRYIYAKYTYTDKLLKIEEEAKQKRIGIWHDYQETVDDNEYIVVFKIGLSSISKSVKNNKISSIPDNPKMKGYTFTGWTYNNKLFDLSKKITSNIVLEPKYEKN